MVANQSESITTSADNDSKFNDHFGLRIVFVSFAKVKTKGKRYISTFFVKLTNRIQIDNLAN